MNNRLCLFSPAWFSIFLLLAVSKPKTPPVAVVPNLSWVSALLADCCTFWLTPICLGIVPPFPLFWSTFVSRLSVGWCSLISIASTGFSSLASISMHFWWIILKIDGSSNSLVFSAIGFPNALMAASKISMYLVLWEIPNSSSLATNNDLHMVTNPSHGSTAFDTSPFRWRLPSTLPQTQFDCKGEANWPTPDSANLSVSWPDVLTNAGSNPLTSAISIGWGWRIPWYGPMTDSTILSSGINTP